MESKYIRAFWYSSNNFGDNLNNFLIKQLSGKPVVYCNRDEPHFMCIGTILNDAWDTTSVWGAGLGNWNAVLYTKPTIYSVRGDLTMKKLKLKLPITGDPCLLLPRFIAGSKEKKHKLGIVPHWKDYEYCLNKYPEHHIVDPFQSVVDFVEDITSCTHIVSTGLHGLIVADSYKIPNKWISFGTDIGGDGFKFHDYYSTTDNKYPVVELVTGELSEENCILHKYKYSIEDLYHSCPFLKE